MRRIIFLTTVLFLFAMIGSVQAYMLAGAFSLTDPPGTVPPGSLTDELIGKRDALNAIHTKHYETKKTLPSSADGFLPSLQTKANEIMGRYAKVDGGWKFLKWGMSPGEVEVLLKAAYYIPEAAPFHTVSDGPRDLRIWLSGKKDNIGDITAWDLNPSNKPETTVLTGYGDFSWYTPTLPIRRNLRFIFYRDKLAAVGARYLVDTFEQTTGLAEGFKSNFGGSATPNPADRWDPIYEFKGKGFIIRAHHVPAYGDIYQFIDPIALDLIVKEKRQGGQNQKAAEKEQLKKGAN